MTLEEQEAWDEREELNRILREIEKEDRLESSYRNY
jgi:hypothetical protein